LSARQALRAAHASRQVAQHSIALQQWHISSWKMRCFSVCNDRAHFIRKELDEDSSPRCALARCDHARHRHAA
jgi:hypothetical protein